MRIATWNINSVRLRRHHVERFLEAAAPDVLTLQETKSPKDKFPADAFAAAGYPHQALAGMPGYNGVAILSRHPIEDIQVHDWCGKTDCRHVCGVVGGVEVHSLYVPSGGDVPDTDKNEKFAHKLAFVEELTAWWPKARSADRPMVLTGDLNIAPLENDVWSHKQMLDVVSHTPQEVERLDAMQASLGWVDGMRRFVPGTEKLYTWWSYRARDWETSDRGRRLDHVWVTQPLAGWLQGMTVWRDARGWDKPSDHVPVTVDLAGGTDG